MTFERRQEREENLEWFNDLTDDLYLGFGGLAGAVRNLFKKTAKKQIKKAIYRKLKKKKIKARKPKSGSQKKDTKDFRNDPDNAEEQFRSIQDAASNQKPGRPRKIDSTQESQDRADYGLEQMTREFNNPD